LVSPLNKEHRFRAFEKKVLRRIIGHERKKVAESSKVLYNETVHNIDRSPNIVRVMKSRRMSCDEYV
jgi:hypothetical protein